MQVSIFVELEIYRTLLEYQGAKIWDIEIWTERAKKSWVTFWLEKLAVLATVAGIGFGVYSLIAIQEEREVREEERKIWYWTLLTTPAPGNSGKIEALEYLARQGTPLPSIDLSCRAMGGEEPDTGECERPVYLEKLDLSKKTLGESANLNGANLGDTNLRDANLSNADLSRANFSDTNLSDADFKNTIFSSDTTFTNAWAWADRPPLNLPATIQIQLCKYYNTEGSSRHRRPGRCIPPDTK